MPISRVLLFILVGFIGLVGGQEHKPEEVISGTIKLGSDVIRGVRRGVSDGMEAAAGPVDVSKDRSLAQADQVIQIQAGLVELGCLSALTPNKKSNIDGDWGPLTEAGYDKFAKNFLGDSAAAEAKLGAAGTPVFYGKLLQQIEDVKKTDRRCTKTVKTGKTNQIPSPTRTTNTTTSVERSIAKIRTIDNNDITIKSFKIIADGKVIRSLIGCWNGGKIKLDISDIDIILFKENEGIFFSSNLSSSDCSFRGFETSIRFRNGAREKVVLRKEDSGPSILGNSQFGQWYADVSNIKQIKFINH